MRVCLGRAVSVAQKPLLQQGSCWPADRCRVARLPELINPAKAFGLGDRAWHHYGGVSRAGRENSPVSGQSCASSDVLAVVFLPFARSKLTGFLTVLTIPYISLYAL